MIPVHKKMIIADDYGLTNSINDTIEELIYNKKIQGVSILIDLVDRSQASKLINLKLTRSFQMGLHWNVTEPFRVLNLKESLSTQWQRFEDLFGFSPEFVDSHHHVHELPLYSSIFLEGLQKYKEKLFWIRSTHSPGQLNHVTLANHSFLSFVKLSLMHLLGWYFQDQAQKAGFVCNTGCWGIYSFKSPRDFRFIFHQFFASADPNRFEILITHPCRDQGPSGILTARFFEYQTLSK